MEDILFIYIGSVHHRLICCNTYIEFGDRVGASAQAIPPELQGSGSSHPIPQLLDRQRSSFLLLQRPL